MHGIFDVLWWGVGAAVSLRLFVSLIEAPVGHQCLNIHTVDIRSLSWLAFWCLVDQRNHPWYYCIPLFLGISVCQPMDTGCRFFKSYFLPVSLGTLGKVDVKAKLSGEGTSSPANAMRLAISRCLASLLPDEQGRQRLLVSGLLTQDDRFAERKKPGQKKARKKPIWWVSCLYFLTNNNSSVSPKSFKWLIRKTILPQTLLKLCFFWSSIHTQHFTYRVRYPCPPTKTKELFFLIFGCDLYQWNYQQNGLHISFNFRPTRWQRNFNHNSIPF